MSDTANSAIDSLVLGAAAKSNQAVVEPIVTHTPPQNEPTTPAPSNDAPTDDIVALKAELELLKKEKLERDSNKELSPEEKQKEQEIYEAELINYAVKEGKMKLEDFDKYKEVSKANDADLVFNEFKKEFKEDNPDIDDEDFEDEARREFENKTGLNSDNEKVKARAEARIKKQAEEIRNPLKMPYETTRKQFEEERDLKKTFPDFSKKIEGLSQEFIPSKYEFFKTKDGDEDVLVDLDITDADKKEIADTVSKEMTNPEIYLLYKQGKLEEIRDIAKRKADNLVFEKSKAQGLQKIASVFETRGKAKASIGAKNSFALNQSKNSSADNAVGQTGREEVLRSFGITQ